MSLKTADTRNKLRTGDCESCDNKECENTLIESSRGKFIWMCNECRDKEIAILTEQNKQALLGATQVINPINSASLTVSKQIDNSVQVRTDVFNAATVSIIDIKKSIDENPEIINKPYVLAETLVERFKHFQKTVFDASEIIVEATNNQKAIQVYLNQLANQLRTEEREKLKIADINYKPGEVKTPKIKSITTSQTKSSTKLNQAELKKYAQELGVAQSTLQTIIVAKGFKSVSEAADFLKSIQAASQNKE